MVEFGLIDETMHKVDENVAVAEIEQLSRVYAAVLRDWFPE